MGSPSGVQCDLRCNRQENSFIASQKSRPQLDIASWGAILSSLPDRRKPSNRISGNWHQRSDGRDSGRMVGDSEVIQSGNSTITTRAFISTNPADESIVSSLSVFRSLEIHPVL